MSVQEKEREFHDALAATLGREGLQLRGPDHLEQAMLARLGSIDGLRVLDLGCGAGEMTLFLAARGAHVTALDISPGMLELARNRIDSALPEADVEFVAAPAEDTGLEGGSVDLVVGKWILHHIDVEAAAHEIKRVLRPGGRGVFIENSADNPVLTFSRARLAGRFGIPRYGTQDEHPLSEREYALLSYVFSKFSLWFPDFCFFQLFDRQVLHLRYPRVTRAVRSLDAWVWRKLPALRRYSYHVIVELAKGY